MVHFGHKWASQCAVGTLWLAFIDPGNYTRQLIADGGDARTIFTSETAYIYGKEETISLLPYGGFLMILKRNPCALTKPIITKNETVQAISLEVNATTNIQWLLNRVEISGAIVATFVPKVIGNYSVRISDSNCESVSDEVLVSIPKPIINFVGKNAACDGDSLKLQVSQNYDQLKWYLNGTDLKVNTNVLTIKKSGIYKAIGIRTKLESELADGVNVVFTLLPKKPIITFENNALNANVSISTTDFQWIFNGNGIFGANKATYLPSKEGNYLVKITENSCSNISDNFLFNFPKPVIIISGKSTACEGDSIILTASAGYEKYFWLLGKDTLQINKNMLVAKKTGIYQVVVLRGNVQKISDTLGVKIFAFPPKPIISFSNNSLISSSDANNQWFENGNLLAGETDKKLTKFLAKNYIVKVSQNACVSVSDPFVITSLSGNYENISLKIYPNPTDGKVKIEYVSAKNIKIFLIDLSGKTLLEKQEKGISDSSEIDLSNYVSGIYFIKISSENWTGIGKVFLK